MRSGLKKNQGTGRTLFLAFCATLGVLLAALPQSPAAAEAASGGGEAPGSLPPSRVLTLEEARALALAGDEQVAQMRETVRGAEADLLAAGSGRLPQLEVAGTWTRNLKKPSFFLPPDLAAGLGGQTSIEMGGDWDLQAAATLTVNLWTAGRLSAGRGLAAEALAATRWREALVRDAVIYAAEAAYLGALRAEADLAIAQGALALAEENARVTGQAHEQGRASRFDLLRSQVELTNRQAPVAQARNRLHLTRLQLLRVCGLDPATRLVLADTLQAVPGPADLDDLLADMNRRSPELRALEHNILAARLAVDLARAGRGPVVRFQGQYALQGQWDGDVLPGGDDAVSSASAALGVSLPVFDGFAARADIQGSEADLRLATLERERVIRDRELGVRQARTHLENALIALAGRREGVDLAAEAHRLAVIRLDNGLATPLERLDAELALTEARAQLVQGLYDCNIAAANLKLAVGGAAGPATVNEENQP